MNDSPSSSSTHITRRRLLRDAGIAVAVLGTSSAVVRAQAATPAAAADGAAAPAATKSGPITTAYVEVNTNSITSAGNYTLASNGANVFDIAIIFAANINYDGTKATLYFNPQVQAVLDNAATQIAPLQAKGIKVLLSILGNHQGAGFANFPDQAGAAAFATLLSNAVNTYGLDGIDFDDEYADYGTNGTPQPNAWSFPYLVQALRNDLPNKIISLYYIGPASTTLSYGGINVGSLINYSWNPYYGTWGVPGVPGMTKAQLAPAAIDVQNTSSSTTSSLAQQTVSNGYGVFNTYNLPDTDASASISAFTQALYGSSAVYKNSGSGGGGTAAYNNTGIASDGSSGPNFDGVGWAYSAQALAAAGVSPGSRLTAAGKTFTWPAAAAGTPDNYQAAGQTVAISGAGNSGSISFLGSATNGPSTGTATVHFTDGTSQSVTLSFSDWTLNGGSASVQSGNTVAVTTSYRDTTSGGRDGVSTYVFATSPRSLPAGKTVASVTLPSAANQGNLHVFAIAA
ncbi:mannosyl-glycoproteinendo-beta-N-acetylglucosaminidase [Catenulispora acidiphila DSM 44928]|uniref:Mannosyl-glycoproteinendo-beta-N-acetylglucosaminidase n=1 Tax=Catenulispora acidiphila (strain DSM 44928 / JCM 14897 / NBRC 102108 / NRRL B-24433 / ID139908) TaxID=479433 RepID=C7PZA4_CATAD|nr:endo-beta-N-acetylglucosaminidase H [Catenulispora acidiphila]ACU71561.1 mannosyl-glycoproteinendo-beta-N-acetylglucosaminidase [Catenulispora acidiphila DSM 44928]